MNGKVLDIVKAGGAIVLAAILAWMYWNTVSNHIDSNTKATIEYKVEMTQALGGVEKAIVKMSGVIEANTLQSARTEEVISNLEKAIR